MTFTYKKRDLHNQHIPFSMEDNIIKNSFLRKKRYISWLFIFILCTSLSTFAQTEKKRYFTGFSGGMMVHIGYLQGDLPIPNFSIKGATWGLGGAARIHLGNHLMIGGEGYVSSLKPNKLGSYLKYGWGGLLAQVVWVHSRWMPYLGVTIGGGSQTTFLLEKGESTDWIPETHAIFHKNTFLFTNPFIGCDLFLTETLHLTLKIDNLFPFHKKKIVQPFGPRFYLGILFYH